jgi:hypothetical protein
MLVRTCGNHDNNRKLRLESLKKVDGLRVMVLDGDLSELDREGTVTRSGLDVFGLER